MNDKALLKLLAAGISEEAAAKQLDLPPNVVASRIKEYVESGILRCAGDRETIDWKAYGKWVRNQKSLKVA